MLLQKYPELKRHSKHMKIYRILDSAGELVEQWELIDGEWKETTELVKAKERVEALQAELMKIISQNDVKACPDTVESGDFDEL